MRRAVLATLALTLCAAVGLSPTAAASTGDADQMVFVGTFRPTVVNPAYQASDPYIANLRLRTAPGQRLLYTLDNLTPGFVAAYDLDSLRPLSAAGLTLGDHAQTTLVDQATGDLLIAEGAGDSATSGLEIVGVRGAKLLRLTHAAVGPADLGDPGQRIVGMTLLPDRRGLAVLSADVSPAGALVPQTTRVSLIDAEALRTGSLRVRWSQPLPSCTLPATTNLVMLETTVGFVPDSRSLIFGCSGANLLGVTKLPQPVGVGRVVLTGTTPPAFDHAELLPEPADLTATAASAFDPTSGRLVLENFSTNTGASFTVFDGRHLAYLGIIAAGDSSITRATMDAAHGRFYALSTNSRFGLLSTDVRTLPLDQGASYAAYAKPPDLSEKERADFVPLDNVMAVDDLTGRLFLAYTRSSTGAQYDHAAVVSDRRPYYTPAPPPDVDAATTDVPEVTGRTGATFGGSAQGYGAVYRQVGGTHNLVYNIVPTIGTFGTDGGGGTRELDSGYLDKVTLTDGEAAAAAIAADRDEGNTGANEQQAGIAWPFTAAHCSDFGGQAGGNQQPGAQVACDRLGHAVAASAVGDGSAVGASAAADAISVAASSSSASERLDPAKGLVTTVTSTARGISLLGGAVQIGEVTATAEAHAHGRPGTAGSTFSRTVQHVTVAGQTLCTSPCSTDQVAAAINAQFAGTVRVDFPTPEPVDAKGSPGGYQALVHREPTDIAQETLFNDQPADRVEVPAMVVTVYEDNVVPSRTIAYLAGVGAEAHYGIYLLDDGGTRTGVAGSRDGHNSPGVGHAVPAPGSPSLGVPGAPTGTSPELAGPSGGFPSPAALIQRGWRLLGTGVHGAGRLLPVWLVLLAPVYLSARRRLLLTRGAATIGGVA